MKICFGFNLLNIQLIKVYRASFIIIQLPRFMKILILSLFFSIIYAKSSTIYTKVLHNTDPQAKCLDGSSPIIYLHEGGDTKNILFHLSGGGLCADVDLPSTLESCYKRSKGKFGTSTTWPQTYDLTEGGILTSDLSESAFANWTKIVIMYCDGAFHQGNNLNPIQYKDTKLYFRGAVNTRSHFKWADNKYNLSNAEKIVLTGSSSGGIATYLWHQYLRDLVTHPERVYSVADSAIFYDPLVKEQGQHVEAFRYKLITQTLTSQSNDNPNPIQILMQLSNTDERPPNKECSGLLTQEQQWKCLFIEFAYPTLKSPLLFLQSSYDQFIIQGVFGLKCLKDGVSGYTLKDCADWQVEIIQIYRAYYLQRFLPLFLKYGHSIWSISCSWHAGMIQSNIYNTPLQKVPKNDGRTMRNATESFVFQNKRIQAVDLFAWPANTPCAY